MIEARLRAKSSARFSVCEFLEQRQLFATIVVNTVADLLTKPPTGTVTLRSAIATANAATTATTITFSSTVFATNKAIALDHTQLDLTNTKHVITIMGPTAGVTISGGGFSRVLAVDAGVTASISKVTLTAGNVDVGAGIYIFAGAKLSLTNVSITNNTAIQYNGAIDNFGTATLVNCTISGNNALNASGALGNNTNATLTLIDCTMTGNTSPLGPGGIFNVGHATFINDTITGNAGLGGGGIYNGLAASDFVIENCIVAGNTVSGSGSVGPDADGGFTSGGYNLIGITDISAGWKSTDLTGTKTKPLAAKLGALANNGGLTKTFLPSAGSPAIDHGHNAYIPSGITVDQRLLTRIANGTVDIGAVEVQPLASIAGKVFDDANGDGKIDNGEFGVGLWSVYIDTNNNGKLDSGEKKATTDISGNWLLTGLAAGTYVVRVVPVTGISSTKPTGGVLTIKLATGQQSAGNLFGERAIA